MSDLPQKTLKVIPEPPLVLGAVVHAPPLLKATRPTLEYACGNCGALLMRADEKEDHALVIHCTLCDSFNSTDNS
jgi:hypothetical protein